MGQKVHPTGFRLGIKVGERSVKDWQGRWFATGHEYASLLLEDIKVRQHIMSRMADAGVSKVEIERSANMIRSRSTQQSRASSSARAASRSKSCGAPSKR